MSFLRTLVTIPADTGDLADSISNTWHWDSDAPYSGTVRAGIETKLTNFYQAIDSYLPSQLLDSTATVRVYDLSDPEPRVPKDTFTIALTMGATDPYPSEIALCLSFKGASESGANMKRRRGRIYLGPICSSNHTVVGGRVIADPTMVNAIKAAAIAVRDLATTENAKWAVFSPTTYAETTDLDAAFEDVTSGWVDNAFDIQRRRGTAPTIRTTW